MTKKQMLQKINQSQDGWDTVFSLALDNVREDWFTQITSQSLIDQIDWLLAQARKYPELDIWGNLDGLLRDVLNDWIDRQSRAMKAELLYNVICVKYFSLKSMRFTSNHENDLHDIIRNVIFHICNDISDGHKILNLLIKVYGLEKVSEMLDRQRKDRRTSPENSPA